MLWWTPSKPEPDLIAILGGSVSDVAADSAGNSLALRITKSYNPSDEVCVCRRTSFVQRFDPQGQPTGQPTLASNLSQALVGGARMAPDGTAIIFGFGDNLDPSVPGYSNFVATLDPENVPIWVRNFATNADIQAIVRLPSADLVVVGDFTGSFETGAGVLTSPADKGQFALVLDPEGNTLCAVSSEWAGELSDHRVAASAEGGALAVLDAAPSNELHFWILPHP
jgi:hypothetical protein